MTTHTYYTDEQINTFIHEIIKQINKDNWVPDYIVGITRGGLIPAVKLSTYLNVPMQTLKVNLQDNECEINCWMAEDAIGYNMDAPKNILIVNDINDTGATLNWIKQDWYSSVRLDEFSWENIWNHSTRFAVLIDNINSPVQVDYAGKDINRLDDASHITFPWENWW